MIKKLRVLVSGVADRQDLDFGLELDQLEMTRVDTVDAFGALLETLTPDSFDVILCGPNMEGVNVQELAQSYRMMAQPTPILYLSPPSDVLSIQDLRKNGFDQIFLFPFDQDAFERQMRSIGRLYLDTVKQVYMPVPIEDLDNGQPMGFSLSVFLPLNNKYVKVTREGEVLSAEKLKKFEKHAVGSGYINESEVDKFYEYMASQLKDLKEQIGNPKGKAQLQKKVKDLFASMITQTEATFENGKGLLSVTNSLVKGFVDKKEVFDLQQAILREVGDSTSDIYSHSSRVAGLATLIGLALSYPNPEDLAIAGLFHDIGLARIDEDLIGLSEDDMNSDQKSRYYKHVLTALNIIKEKKMILTQDVQDIICQHLERPDGKGGPKGINRAKISQGAQILRLADRLDQLMAVSAGKQKRSLVDSLDLIKQEGSVEIEMVHQVKKLVA